MGLEKLEWRKKKWPCSRGSEVTPVTGGQADVNGLAHRNMTGLKKNEKRGKNLRIVRNMGNWEYSFYLARTKKLSKSKVMPTLFAGAATMWRE